MRYVKPAPGGECETCLKPFADEEARELAFDDPAVKQFCWTFPDDGDVCDGTGEVVRAAPPTGEGGDVSCSCCPSCATVPCDGVLTSGQCDLVACRCYEDETDPGYGDDEDEAPGPAPSRGAK